MIEIVKSHKGGARRGAGRKRIWRDGSLLAWVRIQPEIAAGFNLSTPEELRAALLALMRAARPELPWNSALPSPTPPGAAADD